MGYRMTPETIESFLAAQKQKGLTPATLERYRYALEMLYQALPESQEIQAGVSVKRKDGLKIDSKCATMTKELTETHRESR